MNAASPVIVAVDQQAQGAGALRYVLRREHLRRTLLIAAVVGTLLTAVNLLDVFLDGATTTTTWLKMGANYLVPFVVANLGLLSGRARAGA
jgi:hypothetical protein